MSIQDSISKASEKVKRKLFDNQIKVTGRCLMAVRYHVTIDMYQDEERTLINRDAIQAIIDYPTEIPIYRFARGSYNNDSQQTGAYLFDILPIDIFTKWQDKIEIGDFIYHCLRDEAGNIIPILLKISEVFGSFEKGLIWKKSWASPFNGSIPESLQNIIESETPFQC